MANIELWKVKKLIKFLESAKGNGTSMISLICPPRDQIPLINNMLSTEIGAASNIKDRVNRQSVENAIASAQQRLKLYQRIPSNGLVIFVGTVITDEGSFKKLTIDFEPYKPINTSLYMCDNRFHTEVLSELLEDEDVFGYIIMDGRGTLYGKVHGNTRDIINSFTVDLPNNHNKGGQSSVRFGRLRVIARHNYVRKAAELATKVFITNDLPNVKGLILAGNAEFKTVLNESDLFDQRLKKIVLGTLDISYGGSSGFNQAIEMSQELLSTTKFIAEKKLLDSFFQEIITDSGKCCYGVSATLKSLELGAVETLIVWESLDIIRYEIRNSVGDTDVIFSKSAIDMEVIDKMELVEWLSQNYNKFGTNLEFVTDKSSEGSKFCGGFGGIGGILRWKADVFEEYEGVKVEDSDDDPFEEGF